jgi:hypothetical protein
LLGCPVEVAVVRMETAAADGSGALFRSYSAVAAHLGGTFRATASA